MLLLVTYTNILIGNDALVCSCSGAGSFETQAEGYTKPDGVYAELDVRSKLASTGLHLYFF